MFTPDGCRRFPTAALLAAVACVWAAATPAAGTSLPPIAARFQPGSDACGDATPGAARSEARCARPGPLYGTANRIFDTRRIAIQRGFRASESAIQEQGDHPDARLVAEFQRRVKDYVALHQKLESTLPSLPERGTPQEIEEHQRALERLIDRSRASVRQGDIFSPEIRGYFRRQLSRVFSGPEGRLLRRELLEDYPRTGLRPQVNERYPDSLPLTPIPARMLALLPALPEELEYRFMGEALILLDRHARLVVDYIERALPR